jgi:hypothetical protein
MTAHALLQQLHALGVTLVPSPDATLHCRAPQGILTPALVAGMRQHKAALLGLLAAPPPEPLAQDTPCRVCDRTDRWDDAGVWRCRACWPEPVTRAARQAETLERTRVPDPTWTLVRTKPRDKHLGPLLPVCACGDLRYWHHHATDTWHCWTCVPPGEPSP